MIFESNPLALSGIQYRGEADAALLDAKKGKFTSRLCLDTVDTKFFLSTMENTWNPFKLIHRWRRYVPLKIKEGSSDRTVYVNVGSLAKRLLFTEQQVWEASKSKQLEELVQGQLAYLKQADLKSLQNFQYDPSRGVTCRNTGKKVKLTVSTLIATNKILSSTPIVQKKDRAIGKEFIKPDGNALFIGLSHENQKIEYERGESVGKGAFGTVYKVVNVATREIHAIKVSTDIPHNIASQDGREKDIDFMFKNEPEMVSFVNRFGEHPYIQNRFLYVFDVNLRNSKRMYLTSRYYTGETLSSWLKQPGPKINARLDAAKKVFQGFVYLSVVANVGHGDLKPDNMKFDSQGAPRILDFGGACKLQRDRIEPFQGLNAHTEQYLDKGVYDQLREVVSAHNQNVQRLNSRVSDYNDTIQALNRAPESKPLISKRDKILLDIHQQVEHIEKQFQEICRATRYLDLYAMKWSLFEILTGIPRAQSTRDHMKRLPKKVRKFLEKLDAISVTHFENEMLHELQREFKELTIS